jgi:hypothetical protein
MSEEQPAKQTRRVKYIAGILAASSGSPTLAIHYEPIGPDGTQVAFAFSGPVAFDKFRSKLTETLTNRAECLPLNYVAHGVPNLLCSWFAIDAVTPYDESLWIVRVEEFCTAVRSLKEGTGDERYVEVLCEEHKVRRNSADGRP